MALPEDARNVAIDEAKSTVFVFVVKYVLAAVVAGALAISAVVEGYGWTVISLVTLAAFVLALAAIALVQRITIPPRLRRLGPSIGVLCCVGLLIYLVTFIDGVMDENKALNERHIEDPAHEGLLKQIEPLRTKNAELISLNQLLIKANEGLQLKVDNRKAAQSMTGKLAPFLDRADTLIPLTETEEAKTLTPKTLKWGQGVLDVLTQGGCMTDANTFNAGVPPAGMPRLASKARADNRDIWSFLMVRIFILQSIVNRVQASGC